MLARRFVDALDSGDWAELPSLLAPDCRYVFRGGVMTGVEAIVASYRKIDDWVRATFEDVRYQSHLETQPDDSVLITFRDRMSLGEHHLDFRCQQRITIGRAGRIEQIEHIDIEGEPEKAERFNRACGVSKPT